MTALQAVDVDEVLELVVRDERAAAPPRAAASTPVRGELVGPADTLAREFALTLVASPQTQRTYVRACRTFVAWLGPLAGPEDLTAANVAAYHAELVRSGLASSTVKKERAALNTFLRWLVEFEHITALQARHALAVKLPRAEQPQRGAPKALSAAQYDDLLRAAKAAIADDPLAGRARPGDRARARRRRPARRGARRRRPPGHRWPRGRARSCARCTCVMARAIAAAPSR